MRAPGTRAIHQPPAGGSPDLAQRPADDDPAPIDDRDRLTHLLDQLHLVRGEDQRLAAVPKLQEGLPEQRHVDRIEPGERLVHQQHLRVVEHGRQELDLLLVALRQLLGPAVGELGNPESGEPGSRLASGDVTGHAVQAREVDQLVQDAHPRVEAALLGQVAPRAARQPIVVGAVPGDPP